jgi:hypothetical protein
MRWAVHLGSGFTTITPFASAINPGTVYFK